MTLKPKQKQYIDGMFQRLLGLWADQNAINQKVTVFSQQVIDGQRITNQRLALLEKGDSDGN